MPGHEMERKKHKLALNRGTDPRPKGSKPFVLPLHQSSKNMLDGSYLQVGRTPPRGTQGFGAVKQVGMSQSQLSPSVSSLHPALCGQREPSFTVEERKKKITDFPLPFSNYDYITLKLLLQV